jgi:ATP-dependent RNA helicase DDX24/MAK5
MYVHRSGRTGRADEEGISLILCSPKEASALIKLKRVIHKDGPEKAAAMKTFNVIFDVLNRLKQRVSLAQQISEHLIDSTRAGKDDHWVKQAAADLGVDLSDDEMTKILGNPKNKTKIKASKPSFNLHETRLELKNDLQSKIGPARRYLTSGTVNLAHMLVSGKSHSILLGKEKKTALQELIK